MRIEHVAVMTDPADEKTGKRLRTLQERVGRPGKDLAAIRAAVGDRLRAVIIATTLGRAVRLSLV